MSLPLHRKYRPKSLKTIVGNESTVASLRSLMGRKTGMPTTYLLTGPAGCGKTTLSRIIAKELGAVQRDIRELNISNTRGIGEARKIIDGSSFAPLGGKAKVYILNECHQSTKDFQDAMLEVLEEPPKNTYFILCTTEPEKLKATVRQRCTTFTVEPLMRNDIVKLLEKVLKKEKKTLDKKFLKQISGVAEGSPRQALVFLDAVIDLKSKKEIEDTIQEITTTQVEVIELCRMIYSGGSWKEVATLLKGITAEPESIRYAILGYLNTILLNKGDAKCCELIELFAESVMYSGKAGLTSSCYMATQT